MNTKPAGDLKGGDIVILWGKNWYVKETFIDAVMFALRIQVTLENQAGNQMTADYVRFECDVYLPVEIKISPL